MDQGRLLGGGVTRRLFLASVSVAVAACSSLGTGLVGRRDYSRRFLNLERPILGEKLNVTYYADGLYFGGALHEINGFMRDPRTGGTTTMDRELLDMIHELHMLLGPRQPLHILSAYRSPSTNARLVRQTRKAAKNSLHMFGRAVDLRLPDRDLRTLVAAAKQLGRGGLGIYSRSSSRHIHLDSGPGRIWYA